MHALGCNRDQLGLALDRDDLGGDPAHHRRRVTRSCTDLEHPVAGLDARRLDHQRDDVGLRNRLPGLDWQRVVAVDLADILGRHELLARHVPEGVEDHRIADSPSGDLPLHHPLAKLGEVCH